MKVVPNPKQENKILGLRMSETYTNGEAQSFLIIKETLKLAIPTAATYITDFLLVLIELAYTGHLGEAELASAALGASFSNVFGYSIVVGALFSLDTLVSQAFGANEKSRIGVSLQQALIAIVFISLVLSPLWFVSHYLQFVTSIAKKYLFELYLIKLSPYIISHLIQDDAVIELASTFIKISWFSLIPYGIYQCLRRLLQNQSIILPLFIAGVGVLVFNAVVNGILIFVFHLGFLSIPITRVFTFIFPVITLLFYVESKSLLDDIWTPWSLQSFKTIHVFLKLAIPGIFMNCAEWWAYEIAVFISGSFGVDALAAMTLMMNVWIVIYMVPLGISIAATTRVGNAVGSGNISLAKRNTFAAVILTVISQGIMIVLLYVTRNYWPLLFTNNEKVLAYLREIIPVVCLFLLPDGLQVTLGGILRSVGKVISAATTNIFANYFIGLPVGIFLAFHYKLNIKGEWIGLACSSYTITFFLAIICFFLQWDKIIENAKNLMATIDTVQPIESTDVSIELSVFEAPKSDTKEKC